MVAPSSIVTPGPNTTFGSTVTSLPNFVSADRKTVSGAIRVTPASIAAARSRCCNTASVSASCVLRGFDRPCFQTHIAGNGNGVGEIVFAFRILVADPAQNGERVVAGKCHQ